MKMKRSEFRRFYLTFAELYGAIHSDDAYEIMKSFFPDLLKREMYADMKSRVGRLTRDYAVIPTTDRKYIVCSEYYNDEDLDILFAQQGDKPFFVTGDLESYWDIGKYGSGLPEKQMEKLRDFIQEKRPELSGTDVRLIAGAIVNRFRSEPDYREIFQWVIQTAGEELLELDNIEDLNEFVQLVSETEHELRTKYNRGFTSGELTAMFPPDPEEMLGSFREALLDMLEDGRIDPAGLQEIMLDLESRGDLPEAMKEMLIGLLEDTIDERNRTGKA